MMDGRIKSKKGFYSHSFGETCSLLKVTDTDMLTCSHLGTRICWLYFRQ